MPRRDRKTPECPTVIVSDGAQSGDATALAEVLVSLSESGEGSESLEVAVAVALEETGQAEGLATAIGGGTVYLILSDAAQAGDSFTIPMTGVGLTLAERSFGLQVGQRGFTLTMPERDEGNLKAGKK